jgi:hypothetical protein
MRRGARREAAEIPDMARTRAAQSGYCRTGATGDHKMSEPRKIFNRLGRSRTNEVDEDRSFEWIYGANSSKKPAADAGFTAAGSRGEPIASFPDEAAAAPAGPSEIPADLLEDARARAAAILSAEAETVLKEAVATVTVMLAEAERERARIGREIARWQGFLEEERRQLSALLEVALEQVERVDRSTTAGSVSRLTPTGTQSADSPQGATSDSSANLG